MRIYRFRVVLDTRDDVFCDVDINTEATFEEFYNAITNAFKFKGGVMSSFYMSNENWDKGEEITLLDMSEGAPSMSNSILKDFMTDPRQRLVLVYDFMRMWCFLIELLGEDSAEKGESYPNVPMFYGNTPKEESKDIADTDFSFGEGGDSRLEEEYGLDEGFGDDEDGEGGLDDEIGGMFDEYGYEEN